MQSESVVTLEQGLVRVRAPNPSPMTFTGTNTYLVGHKDVAVIDPGPDLPAHTAQILASVPPGGRITAILVTHAHLDHSPLARPLSDRTGAPVHAAGDALFGRSPLMQRLAGDGGLGGGEGVDHAFIPDCIVREGNQITGGFGTIGVLATPGHMANHLSFVWNGALFSGDVVMGWSTSLVSPPDGDMSDFMATIRKLAARRDRIYFPGHGEPVTAPQERARALQTHREGREAQILSTLTARGPAEARTLAEVIYDDTPTSLMPAAERNVLAHLIDMKSKNVVTAAEPITRCSLFSAL